MVHLAKFTDTRLEDLHFKPKQHVEYSDALPAFQKHACFQSAARKMKSENLKKKKKTHQVQLTVGVKR